MLDRILRWSIRLKPGRVGIIAGFAVMVTVLLVAATQYKTSLNAIKIEVALDLQRTARIAAKSIDGDLHRTFTLRSQESTPEYEKAVAPLAQLLEASEEIAFVYTLIPDRGRARFVLDPTAEGDEDGDGVDDKSHIMQLYPEVSEEALRALREKISLAEDEPISDDWGTFISGYAPFYDSAGDFVGIVGVDLEAQDYADRLLGVKKAALMALIVGLLLAAGIGLLAGLAQMHSLRTHEEILDRQRQLTEAKADLEEAVASEQAAKEQMRVASQRFQLLFSELPVACFTYDGEGRICEWNALFEDLFKFQVESVFLRPILEVFPSLNEDLVSAITGPALRDFEWKFTRMDGEELTLLTTAFSIELGEQQLGGIGSILDISERKQLETKLADQLIVANELNDLLDKQRKQLELTNRQLEELSITDGLTGVRNRRSMEAEMSKHLELARRQGSKLSVVLLDVDHFKQFNDKFGHLAGDEVLKTVGAILKEEARLYDIIARYGGEEFCVILPDTDVSGSLNVAERLRRAIEGREWKEREVTASFGVATWDFKIAGDALVSQADMALYRAKEAGRNCVRHSAISDAMAA